MLKNPAVHLALGVLIIKVLSKRGQGDPVGQSSTKVPSSLSISVLERVIASCLKYCFVTPQWIPTSLEQNGVIPFGEIRQWRVFCRFENLSVLGRGCNSATISCYTSPAAPSAMGCTHLSIWNC